MNSFIGAVILTDGAVILPDGVVILNSFQDLILYIERLADPETTDCFTIPGVALRIMYLEKFSDRYPNDSCICGNYDTVCKFRMTATNIVTQSASSE